jgi:hypothetical protein
MTTYNENKNNNMEDENNTDKLRNGTKKVMTKFMTSKKCYSKNDNIPIY